MHINHNLEQINTFEPYLHEGVQHPKSIFKLWDRDEKAAIGIYQVVHEPVADGLIATGWSYKIKGNYAIATPTLIQEPEPTVEVPEKVSRAQGKHVLVLNNLWTVVIDYIESIEDETEKALTEIAFYDTHEWQRNSPSLSRCANAIGLSEEELDSLFIQASGLSL